MNSQASILFGVLLGGLLLLPPSLAGDETPRSESRRQASSSSRVRSSPPSRPSAPPPTTHRGSSPRTRGSSEPGGSSRSGTWVDRGSRHARPNYRSHYYYPSYYYPSYYYWPWYGYDYGYGYGYWGAPYFWGGYWGPYFGVEYRSAGSTTYRGSDAGALDLDISPEDAMVAVDGRMVGVADDFDGFPDYLWLEQGVHELHFFLEGYETRSQRVEVVAGVVQQLDFELLEGESVRPDLTPSQQQMPQGEPVASGLEETRSVEGREAGTLWLRIAPGDASVYLDGRFLGTAEELSRLHAGMLVEPGRHLVQVVRPGYRSQERDFELAPDGEIDISVDLEAD